MLDVATHYADIRYKEGKNNDSIFGSWYGMNYAPWCAMFVSYCFNKVGAGKLVAAGSNKGFASCTTAVRWFKAHKRLISTRNAQPGDIVFLNFRNASSPDHVGLVISNDRKHKVLQTVEGNTVNPNGKGDQVNGDGVYYKTRPYGYVIAVARPNWSVLNQPNKGK